jgi:hypothetical protein
LFVLGSFATPQQMAAMFCMFLATYPPIMTILCCGWENYA